MAPVRRRDRPDPRRPRPVPGGRDRPRAGRCSARNRAVGAPHRRRGARPARAAGERAAREPAPRRRGAADRRTWASGAAHLLDRLERQIALTGDPALASAARGAAGLPGGRTRAATGAARDRGAAAAAQRRPASSSFISTVATFGTAVEVTASELSIESFFPADEQPRTAVAPRPAELRSGRSCTASRSLLAAPAGGAAAALAAPRAPAAAPRDPVDHTQPAAPDGTPICAKWVPRPLHGRARRAQLADLAPAARPALRLRLRPRARLEPARLSLSSGAPGCRPSARSAPTRAATSRTPASRCSSSTTTARGSPGWSCSTRAPARRGAAPSASTRSRPGCSGAGAPGCSPTSATWPTSARRSPTAPTRDAAPAACGCCRAPAAGRSTRSGTRRSTSAASARPTRASAIDNAITQFDPAAPERVVFNKRFACGPHDPAGWDSYCKGDKRTVLHPRWVVRNRGRVALPHRRLRPPRAPPGCCRWSSRGAARRPVGRVLRRRERLHHGAARATAASTGPAAG